MLDQNGRFRSTSSMPVRRFPTAAETITQPQRVCWRRCSSYTTRWMKSAVGDAHVNRMEFKTLRALQDRVNRWDWQTDRR
jgi:hypothetical protein